MTGILEDFRKLLKSVLGFKRIPGHFRRFWRIIRSLDIWWVLENFGGFWSVLGLLKFDGF